VRPRPAAAAAARALGFGALLEPAQHPLRTLDLGARLFDLAFNQTNRFLQVRCLRPTRTFHTCPPGLTCSTNCVIFTS
jgi:hypothetical protein